MSESESFSMANSAFLEELYGRYSVDPASVDLSWRHFFQGMQFAMQRSLRGESGAVSGVRSYHLIQAYRTYGHLLAKFNPIGINPIEINPIDSHPAEEVQEEVQELSLAKLGFEQEELPTLFPTWGLLSEEFAPLQTIIATLREIYCGRIGIEYMDIQSPEMAKWLQERIEPTRFQPQWTLEQKRRLLHVMNQAELFERFLHTKYVGQKRFSLEGAETLIPILATIVDIGAQTGMEEFVIGMAHRGRLNVLANILKRPYAQVFHDFEDSAAPQFGSGDVKYHKGFSATVTTSQQKSVHLSLTPNPSHLESVYPVVMGGVRAKQHRRGDQEQKRVVPLMIHGDAAIAGQGVVYETLQMSKLAGYGVGGTIHIVINNQIGFTTLPKDGRSTRYCTDVARTFSAPVFHVNVEDPEGCVYAARLAVELRQRFHCDVFIDLNCYRKYGHNETDEPAFTQPVQYQLIHQKQSPRQIYRDALIHQGVVEKQVAEELEKQFEEELQHELDAIKAFKTEPTPESVPPLWENIKKASRGDLLQPFPTGVPQDLLQQLSQKFCAVPEDFHLHRKIAALLSERLAMVQEKDKKVDWGMAEHLAFATLLWEGIHVRLSGQDTRRGTFSHRHAAWMDQEDNREYFALAHLKPDQGEFEVINSHLSEYAVLAFEFGYSLADPQSLVIWEAQFGDFANAAQVVIDQYLSTSEQKWGRLSGEVLFLPHGYEGQGPEHSSGRIERFLILAGDNNMQIANLTLPAQLFHLLRRQVLRQARKPLIVFTPKGFLRHPDCVSPLQDFTQGSFQEILDDQHPPATVHKLLFCSGRIYYDLMAERQKRSDAPIAVIRIEQLYPFHAEAVRKLIARYASAQEYMWVQEEPMNMGAWRYCRREIQLLLPQGAELRYAGRKHSASPATGSYRVHKAEQEAILQEAFA